MQKKRVAGIVSLCVAGAGIARGAISFAHFHAVERDFDQVQVGESSGSVIRLLGRPNFHSGACLQDLRVSQGCTSELVYSHPFAPLEPEYYVVDLSADKKVISADHLIPP